MPKTPKSSTPSLLGRVVRKLNSSRKAHPHRFVFEPKKLLIDTDERWRPVEHIVLAFRHRHRLFRSKMRSLEDSCSVGNRRVIVWPDRVVNDPIEIVTTLYNRRKQCNELDDKEWTLFVEGPMVQTMPTTNGAAFSTSGSSVGTTSTATTPGGAKLLARPLATAELNVRVLIGPADCVAEVRLELRPIHEGVLYCSLDLVVHCFPFDNECVSPFSHQLLTSTPNTPSNTATESAAETEHTDHHHPPPAEEKERKEPLPSPHSVSEHKDIDEPWLNPHETGQSIAQSHNTEIVAEYDDGGQCSGTASSSTAPPPLATATAALASSPSSTASTTVAVGPLTPTAATTTAQATATVASAAVTTAASVLHSPVRPAPPAPFHHRHNDGCRNDQSSSAAPSSSSDQQQQQVQAVHDALKLQRKATGNAAEAELIVHHLRLIEEKEQLSRRQDFLHETEQRIAQLRSKIVAEDDGRVGGMCNGTTDASHELAERLAQCVRQISEIEQQDIFIGERMLEIATGSAAEAELIDHHLRLIEEKEQLSRRQDFLNAKLDLHETEQRIAQLRSKIVAEDDGGGGMCNGTTAAGVGSPSSPFYAALRHQNNTALLMELKQQIDHKNDLVMRISDYEDEA